jgi:hypothetical protein
MPQFRKARTLIAGCYPGGEQSRVANDAPKPASGLDTYMARLSLARLPSRVPQALLAALVLFAVSATSAFGYYEENYGGYTICGSRTGTCYVQSSGAHTFTTNVGASTGTATYLACQLFNHSGGVDKVSHGFGNCCNNYSGAQYVWARVYNEDAFPDRVFGYANTA